MAIFGYVYVKELTNMRCMRIFFKILVWVEATSRDAVCQISQGGAFLPQIHSSHLSQPPQHQHQNVDDDVNVVVNVNVVDDVDVDANVNVIVDCDAVVVNINIINVDVINVDVVNVVEVHCCCTPLTLQYYPL